MLCLVAVVVGTLWILQPTFAGAESNSERPLLSDLGRPGASESQRSVNPTSDQQPGGFTENLPVATPVIELEDPYDSEAQLPIGADMSDLSGQLGDEAPQAASESRGFMRLESTERRPAGRSADGGGSFDLSSEPAGATRSVGGSASASAYDSGAAAAPTGSARLPEGLVDPGVKKAFETGVRMQKAGDLAAAQDAYKRALKFDSHNAKVNANLGVLYEGLGRLGLAESHLRRSIAVAPDNARSHNNLGVVLYRQGNYDAAMLEFGRTLELDPRRLDAYTNKGLIFIRWGQHAEAERAFVQVLTIDPKNALAHYNLGMVYEDQELWGQAIRHYYEFVSLGGADHPEITVYLGDHLAWLEGLVGQGRGR